MTDEQIIKELECRIDNFSKSVLDLINRQRAEIENLKRSKSTSLKEFAERVNEELTITGNNRGIVPIIIDNLVKEMESENK